jgi:anti-sigma factor RsiW
MSADKKCPELESLAAYIDGALSEQRSAMEHHLVVCQRCRHLVARIVKSQSVVPDPVRRDPTR